jgi:plastocyanin
MLALLRRPDGRPDSTDCVNGTFTRVMEAARSGPAEIKRIFMNQSRYIPRVFSSTLGIAVICGLLGSGMGLGFGAALTVSQKGRAFAPGDVSINRGDVIQILNDDGDLRHHVYVDSDKFNFDSGDQEPGSRVTIRFPVAGTFDVLCAIHPKMRLLVQVK